MDTVQRGYYYRVIWELLMFQIEETGLLNSSLPEKQDNDTFLKKESAVSPTSRNSSKLSDMA